MVIMYHLLRRHNLINRNFFRGNVCANSPISYIVQVLGSFMVLRQIDPTQT